MAYRSEIINVGSGSPTLLTPGADVGGNGRRVWITVGAGANIFTWGDNTVAVDGTKGAEEEAGTSFVVELGYGEDIYAKTAAGTSACKVRQTGVSLT